MSFKVLIYTKQGVLVGTTNASTQDGGPCDFIGNGQLMVSDSRGMNLHLVDALVLSELQISLYTSSLGLLSGITLDRSQLVDQDESQMFDGNHYWIIEYASGPTGFRVMQIARRAGGTYYQTQATNPFVSTTFEAYGICTDGNHFLCVGADATRATWVLLSIDGKTVKELKRTKFGGTLTMVDCCFDGSYYWTLGSDSYAYQYNQDGGVLREVQKWLTASPGSPETQPVGITTNGNFLYVLYASNSLLG